MLDLNEFEGSYMRIDITRFDMAKPFERLLAGIYSQAIADLTNLTNNKTCKEEDIKSARYLLRLTDNETEINGLKIIDYKSNRRKWLDYNNKKMQTILRKNE